MQAHGIFLKIYKTRKALDADCKKEIIPVTCAVMYTRHLHSQKRQKHKKVESDLILYERLRLLDTTAGVSSITTSGACVRECLM